MAVETKIVIVDRSELSDNIYRLLLSPLSAALVLRKRFAEIAPLFSGHNAAQLGIFNSNTFGGRFSEIAGQIEGDRRLTDAKKIFLCKDTPSEEEYIERLSKIPNSKIVMRPFHPDDFAAEIAKFMARKGRRKK